MLMQILADSAVPYFLIFARILAFATVAPLLSSAAIPFMVRVVLSLAIALTAVRRYVAAYGMITPLTGLEFVLLLAGEVVIGIILAFFLSLVFSIFQLVGQFFSMPMGFSASAVFDPLAQIEIPVLGQMLNLFAMFVLLSVRGFQRMFFSGILSSIDSLSMASIASQNEDIMRFIIAGLANLFVQAFVIALPIVSTLFLISISLGLLAKAAPQMNLLLLGFPLSIGVAFLIMLGSITALLSSFDRIITWSFAQIGDFLGKTAGLVQ